MTQFTFKKVLIIDDTKMDRFVAEHNIKKYAFAETVIQVDCAQKGLDYLYSFKDSSTDLPDIIFLDIRMPEIDGFGFLNEYEKLPVEVRKKSIIVMLSSSLDPGDHQKARDNKYVRQFLNKPLNKEQLNSLEQFMPSKTY